MNLLRLDKSFRDTNHQQQSYICDEKNSIVEKTVLIRDTTCVEREMVFVPHPL